MFRGISLFILYIWFLGWNVWGWNKFNVNYRLIFAFNHHYSSTQQILSRAAIQTVIFFTLYGIYFLEDNSSISNFFVWLPQSYISFIVWVCYFGYIFFPSYSIFNGPGRLYFYNLLNKCLFSVFYKMEFSISFATD